jgi:hypothetical protein
VYLRYQNPSGSQIVAGVEGASTGNTYQVVPAAGNSFQTPNAFFTGPVDGNNIGEVDFNI